MKYKPKPKIPAGSVPRERESTPSADTGKETTPTPVTGEATANVSPSTTDSLSRLKEVRTPSLNSSSQESPNVPVSTVNCTTSPASNDTSRTSTCSPIKTGLASNSDLTTSSTSLTGFRTSSPTRGFDSESNLEPIHLATNNTRTCSSDVNNDMTGLVVNTDSDRQNNDYSSFMASGQFNSSSFEESLPSALQVESVTICDDNTSLHVEDVTMESNVILQPSSQRYPSFIESLSSSILSQVTSSHRVLGLEQPAGDELVSSSAVETTYRRRCCDEESDDGNDEEMDVFDSCVDDRVATGSSNDHTQPQVYILLYVCIAYCNYVCIVHVCMYLCVCVCVCVCARVCL